MRAFDRIELDALTPVGSALHRPECVLCTSDGAVIVSDWAGGVCRIGSDGAQRRLLATNAPIDLRPNGIALLRDGSFLLANLGPEGGVWQLSPSGDVDPFLLEVDGLGMPPTNFVLVDAQERIWITVSTRVEPRADA